MPVAPRCRRIRSLRWRLLRAVFSTALLVWGLIAILSYWQARHEAEELMDGHLAQSGRLLLALVRDNESHLTDLATRLTLARSTQAHRYESPIEFQIGRSDGSLLLRSEHAPASSLSASPGYQDVVHAGDSWRVLTIAAPSDDYRVQVAQLIHLRDRAALEVAGRTVLPIALISPLLLLLIYYSVRRGLKPLDDLAAEVAARSPENLKPLADQAAPLEARPLVSALNQLLVRLAGVLDQERRFTADAAHELRTPLAVVRIQAQVAQLSKDADDRQHALSQIVLGADRAARVLEQLLRLARLDPLAQLPNPVAVNLVDLARRVLVEVRQAFPARDVRLQTSDASLLLSGDPELLEIALRNLLDNAVHHTPDGTTITLVAQRQDGDIALGVTDDGPGVRPDELPRLVERFYRGREAIVEGSGLGLAIARRIAELHAARLEVQNLPGGGFAACLRWPADGR